MTNFDFLTRDPQFDVFSGVAVSAEEIMHIDTAMGVINCRRAMEFAVKWMYSVDDGLVMPAEVTLKSLIKTPQFRDIVGDDIEQRMDSICRISDTAAQNSKVVTAEQGLSCLRNLYAFMDFVACCYAAEYTKTSFDPLLVQQQTETLLDNSVQINFEQLLEENAVLKEELTARRRSRQTAYVPQEYKEEGMKKKQWYKDMVFYQVWPRSFKDGNGDGMGDLYGVYEKLDYIKSLGCDGIWFSPLYPSPGVDCGYDISDYYDIAEEFGGMAAFRKVLDGAHERGMKVIMDLVVNHTSTQHEWFRKSRQGIEPYTDYYIWRPAKPNGKLPNNWDSLFEGKAWAWDEVRGEYYMHLFAIEQADLNMDNPLVREEVKKILRFWLDMGVDGFREDVITFISKKDGLPDDRIMPASKGFFLYNHGPHLHEYLEEFQRDVFSHYDCMTLAEAPMVKPKKALEYIDETKAPVLDMMIQFDTQEADCLFTDFNHMPFNLRKLKRAYSNWQNGLEGKGWNMLYIENHDHARMVSRYGSEKYRDESAKMLAVSYLFQKGTPFVYQGQEIGMSNWYPSDPEMYEDVQTRWQYFNVATKKAPEKRLLRLWHGSRDSARTPVQWSAEEHAGFTTGTPWFYVNENYVDVNVAAQEREEDSVLNFYRKAIALRKSLGCVRNGSYKEYGKHSAGVYTYAREDEKQKILVVCSYTEQPLKFAAPKGFDMANARLVLQNYAAPEAARLQPYETRVYLWEKQE